MEHYVARAGQHAYCNAASSDSRYRGSPARATNELKKSAASHALEGSEHKHAVALLLGVYNFVRKHATLGTSPAVAAGLEEKPWSLERVVEMTETYWQPKLLMVKKEKQ